MGVTIKPQIQFRSINLNQIPPFLSCLKCQKCIPSITFTSKSCFVWINLNCQFCKYNTTMNIEDYFLQLSQLESKTHYCTFNNSHSEIESINYCYHCNKWLCQLCIDHHKLNDTTKTHSIIQKEIFLNTKCFNHKDKSVASYCYQCNISICDICKNQFHSNHSIIIFNAMRADINKIIDRFPLFEDKRKQNKTIRNELIALIDKEIDEFNKFKYSIQSAYERNENTNKMIHDLLSSFKSIYMLLHDVPYYDLMTNIMNNFNLDIDELKNIIHDKTLKRNCLNAINYWNSHYIIRFKNDIKCLSTIEVTNDKTLCMVQLNDQRIVTGTNNKEIKIWSIDQFECINSIQGHQDKVFSLSQLNDEQLLSGSVKEIKCWNVIDWSCLVTLTDHSNTVFSIIQLKDNRFASGSADKSIKIWDSITYKCLHTLKEHECTIYCLSELKDGKIASGSRDKTIRLWDVQQMKSKACLKGHNENVNCLLQLKNGNLASGSSDNTVRLWDIDQCILLRTFDGSKYNIFSLLQSNDESLVFGTYKEIIIWHIDLNSVKIYTGHKGAIRGLIKLRDQRIASYSDDQSIKLWEI